MWHVLFLGTAIEWPGGGMHNRSSTPDLPSAELAVRLGTALYGTARGACQLRGAGHRPPPTSAAAQAVHSMTVAGHILEMLHKLTSSPKQP